MIEIGHFSLVLALGVACIQIGLSGFGAYTKNLGSIDIGVRAAKICFCLVSLSFGLLIIGFLHNDFSVRYIANNSTMYLPWYYKVSAVWSSHEGSLLLWVWILTLWTFLVSQKAQGFPPHFRATVIAVLGCIAAGFLAFVLFTSNPFERLLPGEQGGFPFVGNDLNPLLQDIGLILHPPILYAGYVGFAVSFAFIIAALIQGRLDALWARWARPWTIVAWAFLTVGIALGSWWAYYELGWGGWWFWDPVENASLMPWLAGTALLHSLAATEKRDVFKLWTAFLAVTTFSLSLIGTFLVRSGVLTSVHAFASDPTRGIFILMLLGGISGSAFLLLLVRAHRLHGTGQFEWISREMGLLVSNVLLSIACLIVFIGTLTPLLYDVLGWQRISIGAAYFNAKMLWILLLSLVFLTFAPYARWKRDRLSRLLRPLFVAACIALSISYWINSYFEAINWQAFVLLSLIITAIVSLLFDSYIQMSSRRAKTSLIHRLPSMSYAAMFFGHIGFLACCVGIILTSSYSVSKDMYVRKGETVTLQELSFEMKDLSVFENNIYQSAKIDFDVRDENGKKLSTLSPEKRHYKISQMPMTEAAILPGIARDIYIALGEPQVALAGGRTSDRNGGKNNDRDNRNSDNAHALTHRASDSPWSVRIQIKPYIRWVWIGALIMACSAFFVLRDKRYAIKKIATNDGKRQKRHYTQSHASSSTNNQRS